MTKTGETSFEVRVDEKASGGRANKRLLEILSEYFKVPKSRIAILRGARSRDKMVEIILENYPLRISGGKDETSERNL